MADAPQAPASAPSRAGYWIGAAVAIVGVIAGVAMLVGNVTGFTHELKGFRSVPVPGESVLSLPAGEHVIYVSAPDSDAAGSDVRVGVRDESTGRSLSLRRYNGSLHYTEGGRSHVAALTFVTPRAGRYRIATFGPASPDSEVAIGPPVGRRIVGQVFGVFGAVGLILAGLAIGGLVIALTALRRGRARRPAPAAAASGATAAMSPGAPGAVPPAGWYADPWSQATWRWWDGQAWTGHTG